MNIFNSLGPVEMTGLIFFSGLLVTAGIQDALTMKISNRISLLLVLGFIPYGLSAGLGYLEIAIRFATMIAIFAVLMVPFHLNLMGGGDVKLMAAASLWFKAPEPLFFYLALTTIFGGVVTLAFQFIRNVPMPLVFYRWTWFDRWHRNSQFVPYGIGIGMGALAAQYLLLTPFMR